ncbi:MAG: calcium-binding protein [Synechococcales bacterium]|nr:calcium-binding protein [Synechococcales bacterium]
MATIFGTNFNDNGIVRPVLNGTALADSIYGLDGNDVLFGFGGNDLMDGGLGADAMTGGSGNDVYIVDNAGDVVNEGAGGGNDRVNASISYTLGLNVENLILTGTATVGTGNALNNVIIGNASNNNLSGLVGNDTLSGLGGNDLLNGGLGADNMTGGTGNDIYFVDNVGDVVNEVANGGIDLVNSTISYTLGSQVENLTLVGVANLNGTGNGLANRMLGTTGANVLSGLGGVDSIFGNGGNDIIWGGEGNDILNGGLGNDLIIGENGADDLTGGAGLDSFRFITSNQGVDTIRDFVVADDTIQIVRAAFPVADPATGNPTNLSLGAIGAGQFRVGAAAVDANDYFVYNSTTGGLFYDRDGSRAGAAVQIAQLSTGLAMTAADIVVVA